MMENLPLGFRFYPTEEELVSFYLRRKLQGATSADVDLVIPVVNIYHHSPCHLPRKYTIYTSIYVLKCMRFTDCMHPICIVINPSQQNSGQPRLSIAETKAKTSRPLLLGDELVTLWLLTQQSNQFECCPNF